MQRLTLRRSRMCGGRRRRTEERVRRTGIWLFAIFYAAPDLRHWVPRSSQSTCLPHLPLKGFSTKTRFRRLVQLPVQGHSASFERESVVAGVSPHVLRKERGSHIVSPALGGGSKESLLSRSASHVCRRYLPGDIPRASTVTHVGDLPIFGPQHPWTCLSSAALAARATKHMGMQLSKYQNVVGPSAGESPVMNGCT